MNKYAVFLQEELDMLVDELNDGYIVDGDFFTEDELIMEATGHMQNFADDYGISTEEFEYMRKIQGFEWAQLD